MNYYMTKCELEIMTVLWNADMPLSRSGIIERSVEKSWKDNSIHILLNGMLKKSLIEGEGFVRSGKVWARLYSPMITVEDYYLDQFEASITPNLAIILNTLVENNAIGKDILKEMKDILEKHCK